MKLARVTRYSFATSAWTAEDQPAWAARILKTNKWKLLDCPKSLAIFLQIDGDDPLDKVLTLACQGNYSDQWTEYEVDDPAVPREVIAKWAVAKMLGDDADWEDEWGTI